jgi:uncharacterized protein (TIGR02594 family)
MKFAAACLAVSVALAAAAPAFANNQTNLKRAARFDDVTPSETIARSRTDAADIAASVPGAGAVLLEALRYRGRNAKQLGLPTQLWCADFMNLVLRKAGGKGTHSRAARSFLSFGKKLDSPRVGAIVIFRRGGPNNGHVGIVRGTDGAGNLVVISGNHGNKVQESKYPKTRVLGYVMPPQYVLDDIANAARAEARAEALGR